MQSVIARSLAVALAASVFAPARGRAQTTSPDPIAAEVARWTEWFDQQRSQQSLQQSSQQRSASDNFREVQQGTLPLLTLASHALGRGHRLAALYRLAQLVPNSAGIAQQLAAQAENRADAAGLEQAWLKIGEELAVELQPAAPAAFAALRPAAVRALAEAAAPQVRGFYAASRDYGRATMPEAGLFYLGAARGQRDFVALVRSLGEAPAGEPLALRSLADEIAALRGEMLAAYQPPLSLDRHDEFNVAHAAIQEAADLDAAGLHHGALLRYVQAAVRFAPLRGLPPGERIDARARLAQEQAKLGADARDHSIAAMLLQVAEVELERAAADAPTPVSAALLADVLPRYARALARMVASPAAPPASAELTVTLVRWPYT